MTRETTAAGALRVARDREILEAASQALDADPELDRLAQNSALDAVRELTVGEFVDAIRYASGPARPRHLTPIPAAHKGLEMRACLSDREFGVVRLIVEGLSNKEISNRLALSDKTVKNHISHILAKLKLTARTQVAVMALRGGIV
jgi:DNA-binding NarL/FixJ family response regulator